MLIVDIPGHDRLELDHLVLDMNGTVALDGTLLDGVSERLDLLRAVLSPVVLTADTHGGAARLATDLGITVERLDELRPPIVRPSTRPPPKQHMCADSAPSAWWPSATGPTTPRCCDLPPWACA